jgi:hypothetical protein
MPLAAFDALPDTARLWLIAFTGPVSARQLAPELDNFLGRWRHKGVQYAATWTLLKDQILAIAEPTLAAQPSGCAIDGMLRGVHQLADRMGLALLDPQTVLIEGPQGLQALDRSGLPAHLEGGNLGPGTPVLDLTLLNLGDLRAGKLVRPLATTWIGRKYKIMAPSGNGA